MQTKPARQFGLDITQTSMQPILDELGIERSIKQLSQAEKEILRYIAVLKQGQVAMGDFANTVESPSNQLKVFKQQLLEAKVAFTNLFIGAFANVLPYANALLMIIKEVSKAIADMFGIKISDYNSGIASQEDAYEGLEDSVEGATDAVKELKRQSLGFDEIHNINEDTNSDNGGNLTGGIDQRLLDAIEGYDNGMDRVRMKATEIRDRIMEWLGFTKELDPLTGEVKFKYQGIDETLSNIVKWWKNLNTQGKVFTGLGIASIFVNLFKGIKKILSLTGLATLFNSMSIILSKIANFASSIVGALNPVTIAIAVLATGLGYVYFTNNQVSESVNNIVSSFVNNLLPLFEFISSTVIPNLKTAWEELLIILQPFGEFLSNTFTSIWNNILIPTLQWLSDTVLPNVISTFENLWNNVLVPFGEFISSVLKPVITALSDVLGILWEDVLVPIYDFLIGTFQKAWESIYEILNVTIIPIINGVINVATFLWKNVLQPITEFLYDVLRPAFENVCKSIGEVFGGLKQTFSGVLDFITGIFTLNWSKAWNGVKDIFGGIWNTLSTVVKTPLNAVLGLFEGIINKIIDGWNWLKKQINKLSLKIPDWIPGIGGEKIGFDLEMSAHTSLPRFANGGMPEDGLFFANHNELVGKFNNGNTAVANNLQIEKGIEEASYRGYMRALADSGINGSQTNQIDVHVHTDEGTIIDRIEQKTKQTGVFPFTIPIN